jgi:hypothetical protein
MADKDGSNRGQNASPAKSLNEQNWPGLLAITALNLVVFAVVLGTDPAPFSKLTTSWAFLLPSGVGLAMIRVINGLVDPRTKHRLVFWRWWRPARTWRHPLPACEAYSVYAQDDDRFDIADCPELVISAAEMANPKMQNDRWYEDVYYTTQDKPAVQQASRNFLFTCDYTAISFVMLIALGPAGYFILTSSSSWKAYVGGLIVQYFLVRLAARHYGIEIVTNAFAARIAECRHLHASQPSHAAGTGRRVKKPAA